MVKKTIKKKAEKSKDIIKPLTKREVQMKYEQANFYDKHPDRIYDKVAHLFREYDSRELSEDEMKMLSRWWYLNAFDRNHIFLAESFRCDLQLWVVEMTNNLIKEYDCQTTIEKTLCEVVALNYWRTLQIAKKFTITMDAWEYLNDKRTKYLSMLWKELDRSNRVYLISLNNLIEIKRPQMSVNIKTKNAYISQNQQINNNQIRDEENIKA